MSSISAMTKKMAKPPSWNVLKTTTQEIGVGDDVFVIHGVDASNVYVGGRFTTAGGVTVTKIAKWDGTNTWTSMGNSINDRTNIGGYKSVIWAIYVLDANNVYVGGDFTSPGKGIAKWNGTNTWTAMGAGINDSVYTIYAVDANNVYIGGNFTNSGGNNAIQYLAKWNGASWSKLGGGVSNIIYAIHGCGNNNIYLGGYNYISKWDGTNFTTMGSGISGGTVGTIYALDTSNVYVGGGFTSAGGVANTSKIAKWDGTNWNAMGTGISGGSVSKIYALDANNVYVGGSFTSAGGVANTSNIAKWDGTNWSSIGKGGNNTTISAIYALNANNVYIGGTFSYFWDTNFKSIAVWK
jgi:hypothetical protein